MSAYNKKEYYSAREVVLKGMIPWFKSLSTFTGWIKRQLKNPKQCPLKIYVLGEGRATRYYILVESLKDIRKTEGQTKGIIKIGS